MPSRDEQDYREWLDESRAAGDDADDLEGVCGPRCPDCGKCAEVGCDCDTPDLFADGRTVAKCLDGGSWPFDPPDCGYCGSTLPRETQEGGWDYCPECHGV